jgi:hypothetical protein
LAQNAALNKTDKFLQKQFVESVLNNSKLSVNGGGNQQGIAAGNSNSFVDIPAFVKKASIERYGSGLYNRFIAPSSMEAKEDISASFGGTSVYFNRAPSLESLNYAFLLKTKELLREAVEQAPDMETEVHYELLLHKIEKHIQ